MISSFVKRGALILILLLAATLLPQTVLSQEVQDSATDSKKDKRVNELIDAVNELGDKASVDYAMKKKEALLKKYPTLERDYLAFVRSQFPTLESEILAVFEQYPEDLAKYAKPDENGKIHVGFQLLEQMCLENSKCSDQVGDLLSKTHPEFVKKSAKYVLDSKPELLVELAIMTIEVLFAQQEEEQANSSVVSDQSPEMNK